MLILPGQGLCYEVFEEEDVIKNGALWKTQGALLCGAERIFPPSSAFLEQAGYESPEL